MTESPAPAAGAASGITLVVRRLIRAPAARLFAAWTEPDHLLR